MQQPLKIIFAGTPEFSKTILDNILTSGFKVDLVLTQMDRPSGRGKKLTMSPVKQLALVHNIEVFQPQSFKKNLAAIEKIRMLQPDIIIVVGYGMVLPAELLDIPTLGCVNIHVSLLPHLRGAAPIARALIAGDLHSGITVMHMDTGLDTGPILLQQSIDIAPKETSGSLHAKLANIGSDLIIKYLSNYRQIKPVPQNDSQATYAHKIDKSETRINFNESALSIERRIRGFNPAPGCFTYLDNQRLLIWAADIMSQTTVKPSGTIINQIGDGILIACGDNSILKVIELQLAGRNRQTAKQFSLGYTDLTGKILA